MVLSPEAEWLELMVAWSLCEAFIASKVALERYSSRVSASSTCTSVCGERRWLSMAAVRLRDP